MCGGDQNPPATTSNNVLSCVISRSHIMYINRISADGGGAPTADVTIIIKPPRCPLEWLSGPLLAVTGYLSRSGVVVRVSVLTGSIDRVRFVRTGAGTCIMTGNTAAMRLDSLSAAVLTLDISQRHLPSPPRTSGAPLFALVLYEAINAYTALDICAHKTNLLQR